MASSFKNVLINTVDYVAYHWEDLRAMDVPITKARKSLIKSGFSKDIVTTFLENLRNATGVVAANNKLTENVILAFLDDYE